LEAVNSEHAVSIFKRITAGWNETLGATLPESLSSLRDLKVLILTEEVVDWLGDLLINWQMSGNYPLIVEIPGINGHVEKRKSLVDSIREAIGLHV
jgi:V/A-type H+-transporting ATPase subunit F